MTHAKKLELAGLLDDVRTGALEEDAFWEALQRRGIDIVHI